MGKLIIYGLEPSPPVRTVMLTLEALGLSYELREVNLLTGEHMTKDFLKKNPQHTVPMLEDNGQFIWDSHAIAAYIVRKYAKNDALYPKDFYQRAIVDQRLHFDTGVLFPSLRNITVPLFFKNVTNIPQEKIDAIYEGYNFLEAFLQDDYLTGKTITLADFSAVSTVTTLMTLAPLDAAKNPKVAAWLKRLSKLPYYEKANGKGAGLFADMLNNKLGKK